MDLQLRRRRLLAAGSTALGAALAGRAAVAQEAENAGKAAGAAREDVPVPPKSGNPGALRLATCRFEPGGAGRIALVLDNGQLVDVQAEARRHRIKTMFAPDSMLGFLASGEEGRAQLRTLAALAGQGRTATLPIGGVEFLSPIPRPQSNIYCVGWNYLDHFEEGKSARADKTVTEYPSHPVFFTKGVHTMNAPFGSIPYDPGYTAMADWEAELAVVIGRRGSNIVEERALEHVFGYSAFNDTTVRDVQQKLHGGQWFKGKSLDGYGPMGPWIVSADGVVLDEVRVICRVNGVEKQNASYRQMYFKVPRIIAELSRNLTLEPGDIIATGTPSGVGFARKPPEFLKPGDLMETEITGVGLIRNRIRLQA